MLVAADLECERGGRILFKNLSFSLAAGELLRVTGANGSGKTSLLRILCGLLSPTQGEVRWRGQSIRSLREEYSRQLLYVGHAAAVKDDLSAAENLAIACTLAGIAASNEAIRGALAQFKLPAEQIPVRRLSQGQRRRAALSRLVLGESLPVWLLDEPFGALDAEATRLTEELIARHVARGATVVYTTHQQSELDAAAARVIDLDRVAA
jgi:heme exporter protein A